MAMAAADDGSWVVEDVSFEDLFARHYGPMVRLAHLLVGSNAVAEELVQDAFAKVHGRWATVTNPAAYLRRAVVNACRNEHRRRAVRRRAVLDPAPRAVDDAPAELLDALAGLPHRQRAAIVLRFYEDLPEADIARALGCRPGTVKSLLHRGLAQLREVVER
jgi:RNA polymerase sigma-70 factor (sigma-E family)